MYWRVERSKASLKCCQYLVSKQERVCYGELQNSTGTFKKYPYPAYQALVMSLFYRRARETRARPRDLPRPKKNRRLLRRLKYPRLINDLNIDYFLLQLITVFPFPVGLLPRFSRSMHFGFVSETNGPRDPKRIGHVE